MQRPYKAGHARDLLDLLRRDAVVAPRRTSGMSFFTWGFLLCAFVCLFSATNFYHGEKPFTVSFCVFYRNQYSGGCARVLGESGENWVRSCAILNYVINRFTKTTDGEVVRNAEDVFDPCQVMTERYCEFHHSYNDTPPTIEFHQHPFYEIFFFISGNVNLHHRGPSYKLRQATSC